jgi:hypothetical protein
MLQDVQNEPQLEEKYYSAVEETLHSIHKLSAELHCQRGVYEVDESVRLGEIYDETKMSDAKFSEEEDTEGMQAHVKAILSKGWVKKPFPGTSQIDACICKAKVLVSLMPNKPSTADP